MNLNTQRYTVNVRVGGIGSPRVAVSQGDIGRRLVFNLFDGAVAFAMTSGTTATIVGRKPSGLGFAETCTHDGGNSVSVRTTEAMTQEAGKIPAELRISDGTKVIGTANFVFYVEPSPHPDGTTDGALETMDDIQTQIGDLSNLATSEKSSLVGAINEAAQSGGSEITVDNTLTTAGAAADAKKTGDEIGTIKADLDDLEDRVEALEEGDSGGSGLSDTAKTALLTLLSKVAYTDDDGQTYYDDLYDALYPTTPPTPATLTSITCVYTQSGTVESTDTLDSLKPDLVVTAHYSDNTTQTVTAYTLSGTLVAGSTSTITVTYSGKTATFTVNVASDAVELSSITAAYSGGSVASSTSLDTLKSDLVVTAHYSDQTTAVIGDSAYTLSGTLVADTTSTITVSYGGKTTTFTVSVDADGPVEIELENKGGLKESASVGTSYNGCKTSIQNRFRSVDAVPVSVGDVITYSATNINNDTLRLYYLWFDADKNYTGVHSSAWETTGTLTVSENYPYIGLVFSTQTSQPNIVNGVLTVTKQGANA